MAEKGSDPLNKRKMYTLAQRLPRQLVEIVRSSSAFGEISEQALGRTYVLETPCCGPSKLLWGLLHARITKGA